MDYQLVNYLSGFITSERNELFDRILDQRTRYLTIVLENIYQPQNASAAMRSVDCFGLQDAHVIENSNDFEVDREVAMGATKWLNVNRYNQKAENSRDAIANLRAQGYRIVATTPHEGDTNLEDFDLRKGKTALFFGTELTGISDVVKEEADEFLKIPMHGFTESFNISVSAAVILHHLTWKLRNDSAIDWKLTAEEQAEIKLNWLRRSIKSSDLIEEEYRRKIAQR
ncbi:RNA methyltransferase [Mangrovibacterium marinum]|uniref:tRNA (guanosine(18)-2'-O)-methyltransferase n=1 Tax=Mangrovibacterium marinum TaxID=1639118 RepID=A0A2T5C4R4_9BACT|nr:RNA methyltransferase [Mangrovibacterium marinum]PTN09850.1 tRNA (guanosine-2'-O-)-methyltransferase [Mangrovibacterium marinum]